MMVNRNPLKMGSPPFELFVLQIKQGKKVAQVKVGWTLKDEDALRAAHDEINRSKVDRRARLPAPSSMWRNRSPHSPV